MKLRVGLAVGSCLVGGSIVLACSFSDRAGLSDFNGPPFNAPSDNDAGAGGFDDGGIGVARGVVLVHAAAFPPFRVCFEKLPWRRPQPEAKPMPNANVVGVEIGSLARVPPIDTPGKVYILDESKARAAPGSADDPTCGERICEGPRPCLRYPNEYLVAGSIDEPLGADRVHVLAVVGCGNSFFLPLVGVPENDCSEAWSPAHGSLRARTVAVFPTSVATEHALPVQLVHASTPIEAFQRGEGRLEVSFGPLDGSPPRQAVASDPALFTTAAATTLAVEQANEAFYGTHGFRIDLRDDSAAEDGGSFSVSQSLAEVQDLADPRSVPTTYYRAASNYALLLLGDPRVEPRLPDGGPNAAYEPRRGVHLLALPVREPTDAGAEAGDASPN